MHTWTRTAAPEQQVLILRSTAYQAWILGLSLLGSVEVKNRYGVSGT